MEKRVHVSDDGAAIIVLIKQNRGLLSASHRRIADYILQNLSEPVNSSAADLARRIGTSEATLTRFCQELGLKGYSDFRLRLAQNLGAEGDLKPNGDIFSSDSAMTILKKTLISQAEALAMTARMISGTDFQRAVDALAQARTIAFFAVASSYSIADDAAFRFSKMGAAVLCSKDSGHQIIHARNLSPGDVGFAVSRSGQSKVPVAAVQVAREQGATTICLTHRLRGELTTLADIVLVTAEDEQLSFTGTSTRISHFAVIEALFTAAVITKGPETVAQMKTVGKTLRKYQF